MAGGAGATPASGAYVGGIVQGRAIPPDLGMSSQHCRRLSPCFGMEYALELRSISSHWTALAVGVGWAWSTVYSVRRGFLAGAGLVNGGFLWLAWKLWGWLSG